MTTIAIISQKQQCCITNIQLHEKNRHPRQRLIGSSISA